MTQEDQAVTSPESAQKPENKTSTDSGISFGAAAAIAFMSSIIISGAMLIGYDHYVAKKFVSIDVQGYVDQQRELYFAGKITDEQLKQSYAKLKATVEKLPKDRIVLMGDAVLGGVERIDLSAQDQK